MQLIENSENQYLDVQIKKSFFSYFHNKFIVYFSLLPTPCCLRAMFLCTGTLPYPGLSLPYPIFPDHSNLFVHCFLL